MFKYVKNTKRICKYTKVLTRSCNVASISYHKPFNTNTVIRCKHYKSTVTLKFVRGQCAVVLRTKT